MPAPGLTQTASSHLPNAVPKTGLQDDAFGLSLVGPPSTHVLVSWALIFPLDHRLAWQAVSAPCCLPVAHCSASAIGHEKNAFLSSPLGSLPCAPVGLPYPFWFSSWAPSVRFELAEGCLETAWWPVSCYRGPQRGRGRRGSDLGAHCHLLVGSLPCSYARGGFPFRFGCLAGFFVFV